MFKSFAATLIAAFFVVAVTSSAEAKKRHYKHRSVATITTACAFGNDGKTQCGGTSINSSTAFPTGGRINTQPRNSYDLAGVSILGGRPSGCEKFPKTRYLFCACAVALHVGLPNEKGQWNTARSYFKFPRTAPASGMVGVTGRHVVALEAHVEGHLWVVYDPNTHVSGRRNLTIRHTIDIRKYRIVNPHAGRYASLQ